MVSKRSKKSGFTLIELMIVVAIIGILAAVAIPKFADLVNQAKQGAVKGNLGAVRSAISIYYGDTEGWYPSNLLVALTSGNKYMPQVGGVASLGKYEIPRVTNHNVGHQSDIYVNASSPGSVTETATALTAASFADNTPLIYVNGTGNTAGEVYINCTHQDTKGNIWTSY